MRILSWLWYYGWYWSRPKVVRILIDAFPPNKTFILNETAQIVTVESYFEDGTLMVRVLPDDDQPFTRGVFNDGYKVFGISPESLGTV